MSSWSWYLTRSTGIVAAVLSVVALMWGLFFSSRNTGTRLKPNWWLALHNWLGGLTLADRGLAVTQDHKTWAAIGIFAAAVVLASFGLVHLPVALGGVAVLYVAFRILPPDCHSNS